MDTKQIDQDLRLRILKSLANPTRLKIIDALRDKDLNVTQIVEYTGFEQSRVSHALKFLEQNCFIKGYRNGKTITYKLNTATILPIIIMADEHAKQHKFLSLLKHNHNCTPCIEVPKLVAQNNPSSQILENNQHTCGCNACIKNINNIVAGKNAKYNDNHTCSCDACSENQYLLLKAR